MVLIKASCLILLFNVNPSKVKSWSSSPSHRLSPKCYNLIQHPPSFPVKCLFLENRDNQDIVQTNSYTPSRRKLFQSYLRPIVWAPMIAQIGFTNKNEAAFALSPEQASSSYDQYANNYDSLDGGTVASSLGIDEARSQLLYDNARGSVLEIGAGTGLNLSKYKFSSSMDDPNGVTSLTLVDISDGMLKKYGEKVSSMNIPPNVKINYIIADATSQDILDVFKGITFDTVVDTFSLCVMGTEGAKRCLANLCHLVKPVSQGGRILLLENTRSSNSFLGWYQDITAEAASNLGGKGCVSNQDVHALIQNIDGLKIEMEEEYALGLFRAFICST